jgi:hypothetical protein
LAYKKIGEDRKGNDLPNITKTFFILSGWTREVVVRLAGDNGLHFYSVISQIGSRTKLALNYLSTNIFGVIINRQSIDNPT